MRSLVLPNARSHVFFMLPASIMSHQHTALPRLLRVHVTCLGTSFPVSACIFGDGSQRELWVAHKHTLPREWLSRAFYTVKALCQQCGAVLSPEVFSPMFINPSVRETPTRNHPAPHPLFSELWTREVDERRTALAPRWKPTTPKLVTTKKWSRVFKSWDRIN